MDMRHERGWPALFGAIAGREGEGLLDDRAALRAEGIMDVARRMSLDEAEIETAVMAKALGWTVNHEIIAQGLKNAAVEGDALRHFSGANLDMFEHLFVS